ncbi:MAG: hypothetical protein IKQ72_06390 [Bacteroidaceae bacterium]|nr:hypothetical protein [Bacteroidaceae bacterium]
MTLIFSCSNESDLTSIEEEIPTDEKVIINYKGQVYEVTTADFEDPMFSVQNPVFYSVFKKELEDKQYAMEENEDGSVSIYDSVEELMESKGLEVPESSHMTRGTYMSQPELVGAAAVTLWDDTGYSDRNYTFQTNDYFELPNLKSFYYYFAPYRGFHAFNDKTSALKVYDRRGEGCMDKRVVFLGYKDTDFRGSVLTCVVDYPIQIPTISTRRDCKEVRIHSHRRLKSIGWNDKISSIKLFIAKAEDYPIDHD